MRTLLIEPRCLNVSRRPYESFRRPVAVYIATSIVLSFPIDPSAPSGGKCERVCRPTSCPEQSGRTLAPLDSGGSRALHQFHITGRTPSTSDEQWRVHSADGRTRDRA